VPDLISSPALRWLFLDLNSYFASVEQQEKPKLRGRPVAIVPMISDATCAIAASYQAKKFGVKTGTNIGDARRMCPGLILVEASHSLYVDYHERIKTEIEQHYPIEVVGSIDEMGLLLDSRHQDETVAVALAKQIKAGIRKNVGDLITCSVGIAPSRFLAKLASDIQKPDGLTVLHLHNMPGRIADWKLTDICGIGRRMEPRFHAAGIQSIEQLWAATSQQLHHIWGGVGGDRFWRELHGQDLGHFATEHRSIGHSHVLAPEFRKPPEAVIVAKRLLSKVASRLRRTDYLTRGISLSIRAEDRARGDSYVRLPQPISDTFTLMHHLDLMWPDVMAQAGWVRVKKIAVTVHDLQSALEPQQMELFTELQPTPPADLIRREKLSKIMDKLNQHYGRDSIALGFMPNQVKTFSGTKIAFSRIPEKEEFQE
jgi:DNA polymerase-4